MKGDGRLDLTDRLLAHDEWMTCRMLKDARTLTDEQLDCALVGGKSTVPWELPEQTLRKALARIVFTKEMWSAAVQGSTVPDDERVTPDALLERFEASVKRFGDIVRDVRDNGKWDETFVDGVCAPPETFTYGGMIAHVITYSACRRQAVLRALEAFGITGMRHGDPLAWEMSQEFA